MTDGNSTGLLPGSSTASNFIDEFRSALLKNSTKTLTSEAEALLQHTFGREWEQYQQPGLHITIPSSLGNNHQFNLLSPSKTFPQIQSPDLDQNELELMMGENTLDWVSSLYNKLPSNELNDEGRSEFTDFDFLGLHKVSISEDQEEEDGTGDEQEQNKKSNWPMACAECGYVAGNRKQLWRHGKRENHTTRAYSKPATFIPRQKKEKPDYKCEYCPYASKSRFNVLRHHQRVHVNQKSTSCNICSKSFKDHDTLKTHIRYTHDNERRHSCELCEKQFVSSSDLQRHRRIVHEKIRDFVCQKCNKRFQTSTNAKRHFHEVCGREFQKNQGINGSSDFPTYVQLHHYQNQ